LERENIILNQDFQKKEEEYISKINRLEFLLAGIEKVDIVLLQKRNKEYQAQIGQITSVISKLEEKISEEKTVFNNLGAEVMVMLDNLAS
jgi:hypothetical protein